MLRDIQILPIKVKEIEEEASLALMDNKLEENESNKFHHQHFLRHISLTFCALKDSHYWHSRVVFRSQFKKKSKIN